MPTQFGLTDRMFSHRELPWHGMGTVVEDAPNSQEAITLAGLDWDVEKADLMCSDNTVKDRYGLVRVTDKQFYGIVSNKYQILQNKEAFTVMDSIMGDGLKFETAGSLFNGRKIFLTCSLDQQWEVAGDKINSYLLLSNNHSGCESLHIAVTPVRVVCNNTLQVALRESTNHWTIRHSSTMQERILEAQHVIQRMNGYMSAFCEYGNRAADKNLTPETVEALVEHLFPKPENASYRVYSNRERAITMLERCMNAPDLVDLQGTALAAINAVSDYETHFKTQLTSPSKARERLLGRTLSGGTPLLEKTIRFLGAI